MARAFLLSNETGVDVGRLFLEHVFRLKGETGMGDRQPATDMIWDQAQTSFD